MKITAIIPTRGRPNMLAGCLHSFTMMQSFENQITYAIACDQDDPQTISAAFALQARIPGIAVTMFKRLPALGSYHNETAALQPAEVYCAIGDDCICASPQWDKAIAEAVTANPKGLWWWSCEGDRQAIYPITSEAWRVANDGRIFTDLFPFWFDDVWLREVAVMVTGQDVPRIQGAKLIDCPTPTNRMRDLLFWDDVFNQTRPARLNEAQKIAAKLCIEMKPGLAETLAMNWRPNEEFRAMATNVVNTQGEKSPPTPEYLAAKARAERILAKIGMIQAA